MLFRSHDRDAAVDLPARLVCVKQKCCQALARIVRGAGHENKMLRSVGTGDEPLSAGNAPAALNLFRLCQHHPRRVRARTGVWFGHHKRRAHFAFYNRLQPALFLRVGADLFQQHHVAVIGCGRVEHRRAKDRAVHFLIKRGHADDSDLLPAGFLFQLETPEPFCPRLSANLGKQVLANILVIVI